MTDESAFSDEASRLAEPSPQWQLIAVDPTLSGPPISLGPANVSAGGNLRLDIGWDAFEQLVSAIATQVLGLNRLRFKRYGVSGQAQHGIDLAGSNADGDFTLIQCKEVRSFSSAALRTAVSRFAEGRRPFGAKHFVVAVSTPDSSHTQVQELLADLQRQYHGDFELELWDPDEINDRLRERADIVARFWTRETAATFCTGAPLPGVAAPPQDWTRVADQVLRSPLAVDGLEQDVALAELNHADNPIVAAAIYERVAGRLSADGFGGHAHVMRRRQLDALTDAGSTDAASNLCATLAIAALVAGDLHQARLLRRRLEDITQTNLTATRHTVLVGAAMRTAEHPLGDYEVLLNALARAKAEGTSHHYYPSLLVFLADAMAVDALIPRPNDYPINKRLDDRRVLKELLIAEGSEPAARPRTDSTAEEAFRLRLALADHDSGERSRLVQEARQLRLPREEAALALGAEARRNALLGAADDAMEHWRQAVSNAILSGKTEDAAGWLYAMRTVNVLYGPWSSAIDEEHLLAEALPRSTGGRMLRRVRNFENDARRHALNGRPTDSIVAARRWLADSIAAGHWTDEAEALELLGDLYGTNAEPDLAALCYQRIGETKKLEKLAKSVGDHRLPVLDGGQSLSWWQQAASLVLLVAQQDLVPDDEAASLARKLLDLATSGRAGELVEDPHRSLTHHATKAACVFAARGTSETAGALMELLANDVARSGNQYRLHDDEHVRACIEIAEFHPGQATTATRRLFDLAEVGTHEALNTLRDESLLTSLVEATKRHDPTFLGQLLERLRAMAASGRYEAVIGLAILSGSEPLVLAQATAARDRFLTRIEPDGQSAGFNSNMISDSYLATFLAPEDRLACLDKALLVAENDREVAMIRNDALVAARNLVRGISEETRVLVHARARPFALGSKDGSWLDDQTTNPHPLSAFKVDFGSASLRSGGLNLSARTAFTDDDRDWVTQQALGMLRQTDPSDVRAAALVLARQTPDRLRMLNPALLASHEVAVVRQLAVVIASNETTRDFPTLHALASDREPAVRILLADRLADASVAGSWSHSRADEDTMAELLKTLRADVRSSVRRAAAGHS
jgi:hypothetical protein